MTKEIISIDPALSQKLREATAKVSAAKADLENVQAEIYTAVEAVKPLPEKGTTHATGIKITTGLTDKWNQEKLVEIERTWARKSNNPFPFKQEFKADGKAINYIRDNTPEAYAALQEALTLTPKKPSFEVEE